MSSSLPAWHRVALAESLQSIKRVYSRLSESRRLAAVEPQRQAAIGHLVDLLRSGNRAAQGRPILVDASFDNSNYWYRLSLALVAGKISPTDCVGVLGYYRRDRCRQTLKAFGVNSVEDMGVRVTRKHRNAARALLEACDSGVDLLSRQLPVDFPAASLYDQVLKRQRRPRLSLDDPLIVSDVGVTLAAIEKAQEILARVQPRLILLSHAITPLGGALAWVGQRRGVPSVVLFGNYGSPRFWRIASDADFFRGTDCPNGQDIDSLSQEKADDLARIGSAYLKLRLSGKTDDIATQYVFNNTATLDRESVAKEFGWTLSKPIISVYASNWFDYPHGLGMTEFSEFQDWIETTHRAALANTDVYWLFRAHPVDAWYGGATLSDVLPDTHGSHVRLCPTNWSGAMVTALSDGLVTYHGTAGIEYSAMGKPVLVADRGWYHDCGFVVWPKTRDEYTEALGREWWHELDRVRAARRAQIFAGWYFCVPEWQSEAIVPDDSRQVDGWTAISELSSRRPEGLTREVAEIGEWLRSDAKYYHTFKMRRAPSYALSNVV